MHLLVMTGLITISAAVASCSESNFSGSNQARPAAADAEQGPAPESAGSPTPQDSNNVPPETTDQKCVEGDKVNFAWSGAVKECLVDQGKTYNFETDTCTDMRQATFPCDWESLTAAMEDMGLSPTEKLQNDREEGAKLVTCGQSKDKKRIVVQWIRPPEGGFQCNDSQGSLPNITTGCYTVYGDGDRPPPPTSAEERAQQVYACMNSL